MSDTKTPLPPLVSDEQIERMSGDPITAQGVSSYAFGECIGRARGMVIARDIYEADRAKTREVVQAILAKWKTELEVDGWENSIQYDKAVALAKSQLNISPTKP